MRILAVSDVEDNNLENVISLKNDRLASVDYIFSCGDLSRKYLEYITDSVKKSLYFVSGNHYVLQFYGDKFKSFKMLRKLYYGKGMRFRFGGIDMHGRVEILENYIIAGFGGAMRYNPGNFQFEEFEMERIVKRTASAIKWIRFRDFINFRKKKEIIVMSHAPVAGVHDKKDRCHQGFKCFRKFIRKMKPILWMHGHVHFEDQKKEQNSILGKTLIANVYSSKIIDIAGYKINVDNVHSL
ncbi:MAG: metallophosphoesterase [Endomicrobia bacterium]|nr:metallophosphoesterase [Endomicrobiia bacterium]